MSVGTSPGVALFDGFSARTVDVAGVAVHCRTVSTGPPVLLLHGYPQSSAMWARVAPRLASDHTVVCADLRGYGDSGKPASADPDAYSFRAMAADQVALMRALGHDSFTVVGHDRGARVAHRMALDHPAAVRRLAVLDIAPTIDMLTRVDRAAAVAYWHWYFLSLPAPFPERLIGADPDYFFETCIATWGATLLDALEPALLAEYRRCWRDPEMIRASCADYRAAMSVDLAHDRADAGSTVGCPTLALWGARGLMAQLYDLAALWAARCVDLRCATVDGGHFFVDEEPEQTARCLGDFLADVGAGESGRGARAGQGDLDDRARAGALQ
jgi:haloacetate dehalogenase